MAVQQIVVSQPEGPVEVFLLARHPVDAGEDLQHLAVDFGIGRRDFSARRLDRGMFPDIVDNPDHPLGPRALSQPFGHRQEAVFDVLRTAEDDPRQVRLGVREVLLRERPGIGQPVDPAGQPRLRIKHLPHAALKKPSVGHRGGQHHERIVVGGRIAGVPDIGIGVQVSRDQSRDRIRMSQPAVDKPPRTIEGLGGPAAVSLSPGKEDLTLGLSRLDGPFRRLAIPEGSHFRESLSAGKRGISRHGNKVRRLLRICRRLFARVLSQQPHRGQKSTRPSRTPQHHLVLISVDSIRQRHLQPAEAVVAAGVHGALSTVDDHHRMTSIVFGPPEQFQLMPSSRLDFNRQLDVAVTEPKVRMVGVYIGGVGKTEPGEWVRILRRLRLGREAMSSQTASTSQHHGHRQYYSKNRTTVEYGTVHHSLLPS